MKKYIVLIIGVLVLSITPCQAGNNSHNSGYNKKDIVKINARKSNHWIIKHYHLRKAIIKH